ncbi:hypothetical protein L9F63_016448, partial [Diploptera punctata]
ESEYFIRIFFLAHNFVILFIFHKSSRVYYFARIIHSTLRHCFTLLGTDRTQCLFLKRKTVRRMAEAIHGFQGFSPFSPVNFE